MSLPFRIFSASAAVVFLSSVAAAAAEMRTWTWSDGTTFQAEFVGFDSGIVMREPSGKTYGMSPDQFAPADRKYLAEQRLALAGGPATDELRRHPRVDWYKFDGKWRIRVRVEASSKSAAAATTTSDVQVERCDTELGTALVRTDFDKTWQAKAHHVDRLGFELQPPTGVEVGLLFDSPEPAAATITRLRGSFKITTGELHTVVVPRFAGLQNMVLRSPELTRAGLTVTCNPAGRQPGPIYDADALKRVAVLRLGVKGNARRVHTVEFIDSHGEVLYDIGRPGINGPYDGEISTSTWWFTASKPVSRDMRLRLIVLTTIREEIVPFDFENLKVPERPNN